MIIKIELTDLRGQGNAGALVLGTGKASDAPILDLDGEIVFHALFAKDVLAGEELDAARAELVVETNVTLINRRIEDSGMKINLEILSSCT